MLCLGWYIWWFHGPNIWVCLNMRCHFWYKSYPKFKGNFCIEKDTPVWDIHISYIRLSFLHWDEILNLTLKIDTGGAVCIFHWQSKDSHPPSSLRDSHCWQIIPNMNKEYPIGFYPYFLGYVLTLVHFRWRCCNLNRHMVPRLKPLSSSRSLSKAGVGGSRNKHPHSIVPLKYPIIYNGLSHYNSITYSASYLPIGVETCAGILLSTNGHIPDIRERERER